MAGQSVIIQDPKSKDSVLVDELTKSLVMIPVSQCQLHLGQVFTTDKLAVGVTAAAATDMLIRVGAVDAYLDCFVSAGVDVLVEIFEGPTTTADGAALPTFNRKRSSPKVATALFFDLPTVTVDGTRITRLLIPGGGPGNSAGLAISIPVSMILTTGDYILRVTNRDAGLADIGVITSFYEGKTAD